MSKLTELRQSRAKMISDARALIDAADAAKRSLTADETARYDQLIGDAGSLKAEIARREALEETETELRQPTRPANKPGLEMPAFNRTARGDSEARAVAHYVRTGDMSRELRASNAADMTEGTAANGGYAVPTGHYQSIIAKRDEGLLSKRLGVTVIPGSGLTINVPVDAGTANEFITTAESAAFDKDVPVLGQKPLTLVKYTKKIPLSQELLADEDAKLLAFIENYVGRAAAKTHNKLLLTNALANGTNVTLAAAAAATASDIPKLAYALRSEYADGAQWVMRRATEGGYRGLTGSTFQFVATPNGPVNQLWGFPVANSEYAEAIATGKKSILFGDWSYMLMREGSGMEFLRDPYSSAGSGMVNLYYYMRVVYSLANADAIQIGVHP